MSSVEFPKEMSSVEFPKEMSSVEFPKEMSSGVLYLVATPIGNLEDITARALRVLREADVIAAEDTRVTRKLLSHFDIHTPLTAYHAHTTESRAHILLDRLKAGQSVALVSDAGTPCLSDPGLELAREAIAAGVRVEPVPGASALLAGLVASGLPTGRFVFEGFLPRTKPDYRERIAALSRETRTVVLYEAPTRLVQTLRDIGKVTGDTRTVCVAREITKKFEEFQRGTLAQVADYYTATPPRGECVIILSGASETDTPPTPEAIALPADLIRAALAQGLSRREAAREVARATGKSRNEMYALALQI